MPNNSWVVRLLAGCYQSPSNPICQISPSVLVCESAKRVAFSQGDTTMESSKV